jgi:hypothetical protein
MNTKDEALISLMTELVGAVALFDMEEAKRLGKRVQQALAEPVHEPVAWAEYNFKKGKFTGLTTDDINSVDSVGDGCQWIPQLQALTEQPAVQPVAFLADGTRFKISYDSRQSGGQIHGIPPELGGRWVAFVAAEDDCHLKLTTPPAAPVQPVGIKGYAMALNEVALQLRDRYKTDLLSTPLWAEFEKARNKFASSVATPPAQPAVQEVRLWDTQWTNVVNHDNAYRGWDKQDAINHAVKMAEQYIAKNVLENKCPPAVQPAPAQPFYKDSTPHLHVGDSAFESWFSEYYITNDMIKPKQVARDAYAAGMGDPLVAPAAQPAAHQCHWMQTDDMHTPDTWRGACGAVWTFTEGGPRDNDQAYCPMCGGVCIEVRGVGKGGAQ